MSMVGLVHEYLRRAESRMKDPPAALARGDYPEVERHSQEAVELSLKGHLRMDGIEYLKVNDVGRVP